MNRDRPGPTRHRQIILNTLHSDAEAAYYTRLDGAVSKPDRRGFQDP